MWLVRCLASTFILLTLACAPRDGELVRVVDSGAGERSPWIGRTEVELERQWGRPSETRPDNEGGTVWIYTRVLSEYGTESHFPVTPGYGPDYPTAVHPDGLERRRYRETAEAARFWIRDDGVIYRAWVHPKHARRMSKPLRPQPPAPEP